MKRELLRVWNLSCQRSLAVYIKDISFYAMEGEITAFWGLMNSGKDLLMSILTGEEWSWSGTISIKKVPVNKEKISGHVYRLVDTNYQIEDWTVAEYVSLAPESAIFSLYKKKKLEKESARLFCDLELDVDVTRRIRDLSEFEKRMVDLAKACRKNIEILIIEDEFEGCTNEEIKEFRDLLKKLSRGRFTVIVNSHSNVVNTALADKYIIFKKGNIVKKCRKEFIENNEHLERYLLGTTASAKKKKLDGYNNVWRSSEESVYTISNLRLQNKKYLDAEFHRGEIVTLLALDRKVKEQVFESISGRRKNRWIQIYLGTVSCDFQDVTDYVSNRIVSIVHMGKLDELISNMTIGENIALPSIQKISSMQYVVSGSKLSGVFQKEIAEVIGKDPLEISKLGINDRIALLLERWYVYHPRVLILYEPFAQCDVYGVALVQSYIKKFAAIGTAVIVVKSREEYMEEISDRIIRLDE